VRLTARRIVSTATALSACVALAGASVSVAAPRRAAGGQEGAPVAATSWQPRPATYGVRNENNIPIRMSDGVTLYADVHRPAKPDGTAAPGRFPVILSQTPYSKSVDALSYRDDYLVQRGYVQVTVDVRGTGSSGGKWDSFGAREQQDGLELVNWVADPKREWSNGDVATLGESYLAINQLFTAEKQPKALKAAFPIVPSGDSYRDVVASGGQIDVGFIPLWLGLVTSIGLVAPLTNGADPMAVLAAEADHLQGAAAFQASTVASSMTGGSQAFDGPFYEQRATLRHIDKVQVPTFVVGGWHDLFQRSEPLIYQALRDNGVPTRLLMGPWTHTQGSTGAGLPAQGVPSLDELALRWFDHYVRGVADPSLDRDIAPVTWYDLGTGKWRTASNWMHGAMTARAVKLSGTAAPGAPGELTTGPATGTSDTVLPLPVQGLCSRSASQWTAGAAGGTPCESDAQYDDRMATSYDMKITKPTTLYGPVNAHLWVSTPRSDGMVALRLEDVAPDGTANALTGGWQVLSLRALDAKKSLRVDGQVVVPWHPFTQTSVQDVPADTPVAVDVEVFPTGATLLPGHTLRLSVEAFDTPHLAPPVPQLADSAGGPLAIWHDKAHPSYVTLTTLR
jgi:putative CocE/NonD family hydrolase